MKALGALTVGEFAELVAKMNRSNECAACLAPLDFDGVCPECTMESETDGEELAERVDALILTARRLRPAGDDAL